LIDNPAGANLSGFSLDMITTTTFNANLSISTQRWRERDKFMTAETERDLIAAIHAAKIQRLKAKEHNDLKAVNELNTKIGELSAQAWRVRLQKGNEE
jgi:hypothetical protein